MKSFVSRFMCLGWILVSSAAALGAPASISFTEINLDWFGLNGDYKNNIGSETRVPTIRQFLQQNNLFSDVMAFEEIVDINLLETGILDNQYQCQSYVRTDPKHQHVVICVLPQYQFDIADDSSSYELGSVDVNGKLRPSVHGILKTRDGQRIAHVFAVHLKANSDQTDDSVRMKQTNALGAYLAQQNGNDPVVMMGDFNTFNDDPANMEKVYQQFGLIELSFPEPYTWASTTENFPPAKLDRVWMSNSLVSKTRSEHIIGPCSSGDNSAIGTYNKAVSDHCATNFLLNQ